MAACETRGGDHPPPGRKMELEPQHYDVDINKEVSSGASCKGSAVGLKGGGGGLGRRAHHSPLPPPDKVLIPERHIDLEPDTPLSPEELKEKQKKVERIKTPIAKSRQQASGELCLPPPTLAPRHEGAVLLNPVPGHVGWFSCLPPEEVV